MLGVLRRQKLCLSRISGESIMEKLTLELSLEAWLKLGVEGQRGASHWRCLSFSLDLPTPPGPLVLMVAVVVTLTLSLLMVCVVLILGMEASSKHG